MKSNQEYNQEFEIKFGTDGWRDKIDENFTHYNVRRAAQGVARYMIETQIDESRGVAVAYDTRKHSDEFARTAAETFASLGIPVYLNKNYLPTPALSHIIRDKDLSGAVMITASHNPPDYNGFKFFPYYGGPAFDEITKGIEELIPEKPLNPEEISKEKDIDKDKFLVETDFEDHYKDNLRKSLKERLGLKSETKADKGVDKLRIIVDSMHGAGCGYLSKLLEERGHEVYSISEEPLKDFGGKLPEPLEENLKELKEAVVEKGGDLGLALDGDGDRFGVISEKGRYISPNEVFAPLADYLTDNVLKKLEEKYQEGKLNLGEKGSFTEYISNGTLSRTIATTHAIDNIALSKGFSAVETPVGFKYLADAMLTKNAFMGAEESGGLGINPRYPEKDGIDAALFLTEVLEDKGRDLEELLEETEGKYGPYKSKRIDISLSPEKKEELLNELEKARISSLAGREINETLGEKKGLKLYLEDGSWCLIRPSGTEDLVRIYGEAESEAALEDILHGAREFFGV